MENGPEIFAGKHDDDRQAVESERDELYRTVGHQQVQIDFLKKLRVDQLPNLGKWPKRIIKCIRTSARDNH